MLHGIFNLNYLSSCQILIFLHFFILKYPLQNQYTLSGAIKCILTVFIMWLIIMCYIIKLKALVPRSHQVIQTAYFLKHNKQLYMNKYVKK